MRLWSLHPRYLDKIGLLALWREALLAQKVLRGKTKGYRNHPQLLRFKRHPQPEMAMSSYLIEIWKEANRRGYNFNKNKIREKGKAKKTKVSSGQLRYEFELLKDKLKRRDPRRYKELLWVKKIVPHPLFEKRAGKIEKWERIKF